MHFSTLALSATALLTQVVAADFLLFGTHERLWDLGPARIETVGEAAQLGRPPNVGFNSNPENLLAEVDVKAGGDIGSQLFLRVVGLGKWELLSTSYGNTPPSPADITRPFSLEEDGDILRLVYQGGDPEQFQWVACQVDNWRIHLVTTVVPQSPEDGCVVTDLSAIPAPA